MYNIYLSKHNMIIDLLKYLVNFTRDYYQQTLFWLNSQNRKQ